MQEERGPRKRKHTSTSTRFELPVITLPTHTNRIDCRLIQSTQDMHLQILSQILVTCLQQARTNENFRHFELQQQNHILRQVWSECFVLRASHWTIDIGFIIDRSVHFFFCTNIFF